MGRFYRWRAAERGRQGREAGKGGKEKKVKRESPEEQRKQMLEAPIPGLIGRLAVPTIISMLVTSIYNMADTYFVSHIGAGMEPPAPPER